MTYSENEEYKEVFIAKDGTRFYMPANEQMGYHTSRYQEAGQQMIYSSCGITKEYLEAITSQMLEVVNNKQRAISDVSVLLNNIRYRIQYPVDEDCALRMSAVYTFIEGEPQIPNREWINKKLTMCREDPDLYAFFLDMGLRFTQSWSESLPSTETISEYLTNREKALQTLLPIQ